MDCPHCGRDRESYAFCCDRGPLGRRNSDDEAFERNMVSLIQKGWARIIDVDGVPHVVLTELGNVAAKSAEAVHRTVN